MHAGPICITFCPSVCHWPSNPLETTVAIEKNLVWKTMKNMHISRAMLPCLNLIVVIWMDASCSRTRHWQPAGGLNSISNCFWYGLFPNKIISLWSPLLKVTNVYPLTSNANPGSIWPGGCFVCCFPVTSIASNSCQYIPSRVTYHHL